MGNLMFLTSAASLYFLSFYFFNGMADGFIHERYFSHNELIFSVLFGLMYWFGAGATAFRVCRGGSIGFVGCFLIRRILIPAATVAMTIFVWVKIGGKMSRFLEVDLVLLLLTATCMLILSDFRSLQLRQAVRMLESIQKGVTQSFVEEPATVYTKLGLVFGLLVPAFLMMLD